MTRVGTRCPGQERGSGPQTSGPHACRAAGKLSRCAEVSCTTGGAERGGDQAPATTGLNAGTGPSRAATGLAHAVVWGPRAGHTQAQGLGLLTRRTRGQPEARQAWPEPSWLAAPAGQATGEQRGSWQTACRQRPLALTSDRGLPQRVHHEAEFAKCLLLNNSSLLPRKARSPPLFYG